MLSMIRWLAAVVFVGAFLGACSSSAPVELKATPPEKPNIIFFLLDDARTEDVATMDSVVELLKRQGTTFQNATLTDPLCCPSRATLLTGLYAHNHGIKDNNPLLGGGEQAFRKSRLDAKTYATALDVAGYKTGFFGKYLNGYKDLYIPPGWDRWAAHIGAFNGKEWNNQGHRYTSPHAMRDVQTALWSVMFVENQAPGSTPFFLSVNFTSPHLGSGEQKIYANYFKDAPLPRSPNFNEGVRSDKPAYVRAVPALTRKQIGRLADENRRRWRSLQTADQTVRRIVQELTELGELDNTYFVFFSDNGYRMGAHAIGTDAPSPYIERGEGKETPYLEDTRFPLIVRGPGVPSGLNRKEMVLSNDLAPTLAELGGTEMPSPDGRSIVPLLRGESVPWRDGALIEGWTAYSPAGMPPYKGIITPRYSYVEYASGEKELYDLQTDPYQLESLHNDPASAADMQLLSARLAALKDCSGEACRLAEGF